MAAFLLNLCFFVVFLIDLCAGQEPLLHLPHNFTLAAVNVTLPNANRTGAPLVLGQNGASSGISFYVTSTYASFPYNDYPTLAMRDGGLRAYTSSGRWITNATEVRSGGTLGWVTTTIYAAPAPKVYSAVRVPAYKHHLLAAHGFHNLWSLCPFHGTYPQTNVVFNVSEAIENPPPTFDPTKCYPVRINIIPVNEA
ncbi:unnamed protein product [Cyclocybe aegerita]|uniref:Uncharacterized protein n=1 Tax=Cyclocybe aegerita TaxID=1973307 RepID=A0A8S0Y026_CYCAE|nr:unnamed protein product [Cyclocybe aegerita]